MITDIVARFMEENGIPYVKGKTWTTDSFYRETVNNFEKHKADGCISVEMECAALQAIYDLKGTQHDVGHFDIALELARYVVG